jgi:ABC-type branched-subunit amino acid transport system substrate-binding protein
VLRSAHRQTLRDRDGLRWRAVPQGDAGALDVAPRRRGGALALFLGLLASCARSAPVPVADPWDQVHAGEHGAAVLAPAPSGSVARLDPAEIDALSAAQLRELWAALDPRRAPAPAVALRLALLAHHAGDATGFATWAAHARRDPALAVRLPAAAPLADPPAPRPGKPRLALLLPLSGPHRAVGRALRPALELGLADLAVTAEVLDTAGEPAGAVAAVERAVAGGAALIVGPVGERESRAAVRRAVLRGVPIATLAATAGADVDAGVYRLWDAPTDEAALTGRLAGDLGHERLAVFAPRDEQGRAMAEAFRSAAERRGARVLVASYDPSGLSLEADVRALLGLVPARNPRLRAHLARRGAAGWKSFSPEPEFELLYVPGAPALAGLIASYLAYYNVELRRGEFADPELLRRKHGGRLPGAVQLVGASSWHDPALLRGVAALQGALVVSPCPFAGAGAQLDEAGERFAGAYQRRTGGMPGPEAARAHDAARLVARALLDAGSRGLRGALGRARSDELALCGPARLGASGALERPVALLEVDTDAFLPRD